MTRDQIASGLELLALTLGNESELSPVPPPKGWRPEEWAYVKGVASGELLRLRDRLLRGDPC